MASKTETFEAFSRRLRQVLRAEAIEEQTRATRARRFRASLVERPYENAVDITAALEKARRTIKE